MDIQTKKRLEIALAGFENCDKIVAAVIKAIAGSQNAGAVAKIADPATATAEDCANKINALIDSLNAG